MMVLSNDETIIFQLRKHWIGIVIQAIAMLICVIAPLIAVPYILAWILPSLAAMPEMGALLFLLGAVWALVVLGMFFVMWTNYYLDVVTITNKRMMDEEQFVLFSRDEVIINLEHIEDVKVETLGFLATVLGFGSIQIQTAGAGKEMIVKMLRNPERVKEVLEQCIADRKGAI